MLNESPFYCPECDEGLNLPKAPSRRSFLRGAGGAAAALAGASLLGRTAGAAEEEAKPAAPKPAEGLIRELFETFSEEQRTSLVLPYDHRTDANAELTRHRTFNSPAMGKRIGEVYTPAQRELVERIARAILADDEAFKRVSRGGKWDSSGSFDGCGAILFGEPGTDSPYAYLFSGHHLTLRCDGNTQPGVAWGGPIYYGHSAGGYTIDNVYRYQTEAVQAVFDALSEEQRKKALGGESPGDGQRGLKPRDPRPGIAYADLGAEQRELVEKVMRALLSPFRAEDAEEVMSLVKANGGMEQIHLAFYEDEDPYEGRPWHFWRLEGPGFVWNYRVLPHVHCFVNIESA